MPTSNFRTTINRAEVATNIMKGFGQEIDFIIKGGEGSKGGRVIGHTKSGKPIYHSPDNPEHKKFTFRDHLDAATLHDKRAESRLNANKKATGNQAKENEGMAAEYKTYAKKHMIAAHAAKDDETPPPKKSPRGNIEKAEGSKGGKVIGHTRSGKPIYETYDHPTHKKFTSADHNDASKLHHKKRIEYRKNGDEEKRAFHKIQDEKHLNDALKDDEEYD